MIRRFRKRAFVPLGNLSAARLGLSPSRSVELQLSQAWTRAAGRRLAEYAIAIGIRRGVLEIRMTEPDESWSRTIDDLLPGLGAAVAAEHPGWGIRAVRLTDPAGEPLGEIQSIDSVVPVRPRTASREGKRKRDPVRLDRLMRAYLSRSDDSSTD
ncbi:MAG: hypothetical protein GTN89_09200 [Acidobacteria bacterium]|nr:hypothetical protein [Acidobacteriota bacterium]NIM60530.1 hypothetical protein [Acidobacteriota bacterium]NIO59501.1 hypothetical protein [Acidobacteriota bacterium]NIQ30530.1 hypothetical protein [Acidobacteriota bacterium]NIQ85478.1 hypothetical protein [Acidobacteriota bacterium]